MVSEDVNHHVHSYCDTQNRSALECILWLVTAVMAATLKLELLVAEAFVLMRSKQSDVLSQPLHSFPLS